MLRKSSLLLLALALLPLSFCSNTNLHNTEPQPEVAPLLRLTLQGLPDDLIVKIIIEQVPGDIKTFMLTSNSLRQRMIKCALSQRFLAEKFHFPALIRLPFGPDIFRLISKGNSYIQSLTPKQLFLIMENNFNGPTQVFEAASLFLFDHFQASLEYISLTRRDYRLYFTDVILNNRSLESIISSRTWLQLLRDEMEKVPNIEALIRKWFTTEYSAFKSYFFTSNSYRSEKLLLAFLNADGTVLPSDLTVEESQPIIKNLKALIMAPNLNELISEALIIDKCTDYVEAHKYDDDFLYISFNTRFNPGFTYHVSSAVESIEKSSIAAIGFVHAGRFDDTINLLLEIKEIQKQLVSHVEPFLERSDFLVYMISKDPALYRWHFSRLPDEFYVNPEFVDTVIKLYGSLDELLASTDCPINIYKFIVRHGTANQYALILSRVSIVDEIDYLQDIARFRKNLPDFSEFVKCWRKEFQRFSDSLWKPFLNFYCPTPFLKAALKHPGAIEHLKGLKIRIARSAFEIIKNLPDFQIASEEVKEIIENFVKI